MGHLAHGDDIWLVDDKGQKTPAKIEERRMAKWPETRNHLVARIYEDDLITPAINFPWPLSELPHSNLKIEPRCPKSSA